MIPSIFTLSFRYSSARAASSRRFDASLARAFSVFMARSDFSKRLGSGISPRLVFRQGGRHQPIQKPRNVNRVIHLINENRQFLASSDRNRLVVAKTPPAFDSMGHRQELKKKDQSVQYGTDANPCPRIYFTCLESI